MGRGTCDYATGECKCFDGFEGRGCRRTTCPNDCSGHGRCLDNFDINPTQYMSFNYPNDQMWDQMRTQSCKCDRGYTGYDCNSRICPFGDDPTSDCGENSAGDVQLVVTKSPHDSVTNSERYFTLSFTDMFGGTFTTRLHVRFRQEQNSLRVPRFSTLLWICPTLPFPRSRLMLSQSPKLVLVAAKLRPVCTRSNSQTRPTLVSRTP